MATKTPTSAKSKTKITCTVCGKEFPRSQIVPAGRIRPGVAALIAEDNPQWNEHSFICRPDITRYRRRYVEKLVRSERGELGRLEKEVIDSIAEGTSVAENVTETMDETTSAGDHAADVMTNFGGSWAFIFSFAAIIVVWVLLNLGWLLSRPFDPYPFILLNLFLSCLAAIQAPVIMMSQRRQDRRDRLRSENDYKVNLKAELEIRQLHEKLDHQLAHQWERLVEIQEIQIEMLEEMAPRRPSR